MLHAVNYEKIRNDLATDTEFLKRVRNTLNLGTNVKKAGNWYWSLGSLLLSMTILLNLITAQIDPALELYTAAADGMAGDVERENALALLIKSSAWGAFIAAIGAFLGAMLSFWEGRVGAVAKGLSAGASASVVWAAFTIAVATQLG